jgi:lipopolysaccharide/colanic/teichoic acid biosynthesis glycosyltransferase
MLQRVCHGSSSFPGKTCGSVRAEARVVKTALKEPPVEPPVPGRSPTSKTSPPPSRWSISTAKRVIDLAVALLVLIVAAVPMAAIGLCIRLSSRGPAIFVQQRVGRRGRLFLIYKFRTMRHGETAGPGLTKEGDSRVTPLGRWLRRLKLDELPQFFNVLLGDLSLVGPRPKLPRYEVDFDMQCRPGITGPSTILFRNEEEILGRVPAEQMEAFYETRIKPLKARIDARYMRSAAFSSDLKILAGTHLLLFRSKIVRADSPANPAPQASSREPAGARQITREPMLADICALPSESSAAN